MNRGNMGKQISNAPKSKSKKVKKMFGGGMASMPTPMPGSAVRPPMPAPGGAAANFGSALRQLGAPKVGASGATRNMPMPMPGRPTNPGPGVTGVMPMPTPGEPGSGRPVQVKPPGGVRGISEPKPTPGKPGSGRPMPGKPKPALGAGGANFGSMVSRLMAEGGAVKKMAKGGKANKIDGCCMRGHTRGEMK